jgi:hypothetical protein
MKLKIVVLFSLLVVNLRAQFPGPAGTIGTTAMHKDSSAFVAWATQCNIIRGYQDISNTSLGNANVGDSSKAIAKADGSIVSLGDGGSAVLTFSAPIQNATGFDFAVFENGFSDTFLELAFVEVSSDGVNFYRFPPTSNSQYTVQYDNSATIDATKLDNLAGKYRALYGTPFDLQELASISQLNINAITHVKIIDVVGSITVPYATYDKNSNMINDPWPTAFGSSGFDLDGVGVVNQSAVGINEFEKSNFVKIYPNPFNSKLKVQDSKFNEGKNILKIFDLLGNEIRNFELNTENTELDLSDLHSGVYFAHIEIKNSKSVTKLIKE